MDYQTTIESIRSIISYHGTSRVEQIAPLAESYSNACKDVNARLLRCSQLIRSGNTSEAVRLAEIEPNLLESFALLDFPEREQWLEVVHTFNLPAADPLFVELAQEINDAYTAVDPLQPLLKKHRLFAISRAPLAERIKLLREMLIMEPENQGWKTDLESYEKVRLRELESDVNAAIASKSISRISQLVRELEQPNWTSKPPEKLITALKASLKIETQRSGLNELRSLAEKLQRAYSEENVDSGVKYAQQWYSLIQNLGNNVPLELGYEVQEPLQWVEEQRKRQQLSRQFQTRLDVFRNSLQSGLTPEQISEMYADLESFAEEAEEEIPEPIVRVFNAKLEAANVRGSRRFRIFVVALVLLCAMLAGGVTFTYFHLRYQGEINLVAQTLRKYIDQKDYDLAETYCEEQSKKLPRIFENPSVADTYNELKTAIDREKQRRELFAASLRQVEESLKSGKIDETALMQARSRAEKEDDKAKLAAVENERRKILKEAQRQRDLVLRNELDVLVADYNRLIPQKGAESDATFSKLSELLAKATELRKMDGASDSLKNERDSLIMQLDQWIAEMKQRRDSKGDITDLTRMISDPEGYAKTLQTLIEKYPTLPLAKDFQTVLAEKPIWNIVDQWNEVIGKLPKNIQQKGAGNNDLNGVAENIKGIEQFLKEWKNRNGLFTDFKEHRIVQAHIPYLQACTKRVKSDKNNESLLFGLEKQMRKIRTRPLWLYVNEKDGGRYYLTQEPKAGRVRYANDTDKEGSVVLAEKDVDSIKEAPHYSFAKDVVETIEKLDRQQENWPEAVSTLLKRLQDDPLLDPLLKCILLKDLIEVFSVGDTSVQKGYAKHLGILQEDALQQNVNWLDPKSIDAQAERKIAESILARLPSSQSAADATINDAQQLRSSPICEFVRAGWAEKTPDGNWRFVTNNEKIPRSGYVIVRGSPQGDGKTLIRFSDLDLVDTASKRIVPNPDLIIGLPVFLKMPR
ncbi:MAG: hypothetical protein ACRC2T_04050 [Thermoguttaceae bacterium]